MKGNLDSREITEFVIASLPDDSNTNSFQLLNSDNAAEGEREFGLRLAYALEKSDLHKTQKRGTYLALYRPVLGSNKPLNNVAVKILEPRRKGSLEMLRYSAKSVSDQELQEVVNIPGYVTLENEQQPINAAVLKADESSDLLDRNSWKKSRYPVLETDYKKKIFGPGHNSFTVAEDGITLLSIYHARDYEKIVYHDNGHIWRHFVITKLCL